MKSSLASCKNPSFSSHFGQPQTRVNGLAITAWYESLLAISGLVILVVHGFLLINSQVCKILIIVLSQFGVLVFGITIKYLAN